MLAYAARSRDGIIVDRREIEAERLAKLTVFLCLRIGICRRKAPRRSHRVVFDQFQIARVGTRLDPVGADDDRPESRRRKTEGRVGRRRCWRKEGAVGATIAEQIGKAVLRFDVAIADLGLEQLCDLGAESQAELVGVRDLQVITDKAQLAPTARPRPGEQLCTALFGQVDRVPRHTGRPRGTAIVRVAGVEVECPGCVGSGADFLLQEVELVAVIGTAEPAEHHIARVFVEFVAEAYARLPSAREGLALAARRDEVADVVIGVYQVRIIGRRHRIHRISGMDEIEESRGAFIIPANAEIQRQSICDLPVVLHIDAELEILGIDDRAAVAGRGAELDAVRHIVVEGAATGVERRVIGIDGVETVELQRVELNPFRLRANLDRMTFDAGPGKVVLDAPTLLALFLIIAATADAQDVAANDDAGWGVRRRRAGIGKEEAVVEDGRRRRPLHIFISDLEIVDPIVGGMLPTASDAQFLDVLRTDRLTRIDPGAEEFATFLAIFARKLDQVAVRRLEAELAEI